MLCQINRLNKCSITNSAFEMFVTHVNSHVRLQIAGLPERFITLIAFEWSFAAAHRSQMLLMIASMVEHSSANIALIEFFIGVNFNVRFQVLQQHKRLVAQSAIEISFTNMDSHVGFIISSMSEYFIAHLAFLGRSRRRHILQRFIVAMRLIHVPFIMLRPAERFPAHRARIQFLSGMCREMGFQLALVFE